MTALRVTVRGIGLLGPGFDGWAAGRRLLWEPDAWTSTPTVLPPPARLPSAERRRAGSMVKLALAIADEACAMAGVDPATLATVFSASTGEGANCHALCEALAAPERLVSPTRFTNSVHNAPAGYWHIATASRAPSTSLAAYDASFAAGLLEAAAQCVHGRRPVLLVAADVPYPQPLKAARPISDAMGIALALDVDGAGPWLAIEPADGAADRLPQAGLEALRRAVPAAAGLPLLRALAMRRAGAVVVVVDGEPPLRVQVEVEAPQRLDHAGIAARIPHRGAMCLLDRLDAWSPAGLTCRATGHRDPRHPLRTAGGLLAPVAIEYAAQAMALHGALVGGGDEPSAGYLASVRDVQFAVPRLDDVDGDLVVAVERLAGDDRQVLYRFRLADERGRLLAEGRAAVVLNTALPTP